MEEGEKRERIAKKDRDITLSIATGDTRECIVNQQVNQQVRYSCSMFFYEDVSYRTSDPLIRHAPDV